MEQNQKLQSQLHATNLREIAALGAISALKQDLCAAKQHASDSAWGVPVLQQLAEQHAADLKVPFNCMPCLCSSPVCLLQFRNMCMIPAKFGIQTSIQCMDTE